MSEPNTSLRPDVPNVQQTSDASIVHDKRSTLAIVLSSIALVLSAAALLISLVGPRITATLTNQTTDTDVTSDEIDSSSDTESNSSTADEDDASSTAEMEGDSGNWHIKISEEFQIGTSYDGSPIMVVSLEITNIGDDNEYVVSVQSTAWQNGFELTSGYPDWDSSLYELYSENSETRLRTVQPGTTLTLYAFFELDDSEGSVELEVYDSSASNQLVTAVFEL